MNFEELKEEILKRAKAAEACTGEYRRARESENASELIEVIKYNFNFACRTNVIDGDLIDKYESIFEENGIVHNKSISTGFCIASGSATVRAWDSATVRAWDSATVEAWDWLT